MNKARCRNCDTVVHSKHRHDFVVCECFIDKANGRGFFLDGGDDYCRYGGNFADIEFFNEVTGEFQPLGKPPEAHEKPE